MKNDDIKIMEEVPIDSKRRNPGVSLGNENVATAEKKKALKPKPASGKAVAVPRC